MLSPDSPPPRGAVLAEGDDEVDDDSVMAAVQAMEMAGLCAVG